MRSWNAVIYQTIDGLSQNISEVGLINPITVKRISERDYRIIAGERRWRACKSLGMVDIRANVVDINEDEADWIMLSENIQRKDLSEVEKAERLYNMMCGDHTLTLRKISHKLGINFSYLAQLLKLHGYPAEVKQEIKQGNIGADTIRSINKLDTPKEQIKVVQHAVENELNRKQVNQVIDTVKSLPEPIKEKLNQEEDYTVEEVITESIEVVIKKIIMECDYYNGKKEKKNEVYC